MISTSGKRRLQLHRFCSNEIMRLWGIEPYINRHFDGMCYQERPKLIQRALNSVEWSRNEFRVVSLALIAHCQYIINYLEIAYLKG
jgi:hypothetical protein